MSSLVLASNTRHCIAERPPAAASQKGTGGTFKTGEENKKIRAYLGDYCLIFDVTCPPPQNSHACACDPVAVPVGSALQLSNGTRPWCCRRACARPCCRRGPSTWRCPRPSLRLAETHSNAISVKMNRRRHNRHDPCRLARRRGEQSTMAHVKTHRYWCPQTQSLNYTQMRQSLSVWAEEENHSTIDGYGRYLQHADGHRSIAGALVR